MIPNNKIRYKKTFPPLASLPKNQSKAKLFACLLTSSPPALIKPLTVLSLVKTPLSFSMDQKNQAATAASKPLGMCERLFSAFQPTLRPLRRLAFRQQETAADSLPAQAHHGPVPQSKLPEPAAPPQGESKLPKVQHNPKPKHHQEKPLPAPAPPKAVPQPPPKEAEVHKPRKGINEKVDEYINRILRER